MGIKGLAKLIAAEAPDAVRPVEMARYFGKAVAVDAAILLYQFLTTARDHTSALANAAGADTGHLSGVLYRSLRMLEAGIKPIFVFDGRPPKEKEEELRRRADARDKTNEAIEAARAEGDLKLVESLSRRTVKITESHVESCKKLLEILGIPVVTAVGEAEAQCAFLVKHGHAHAVATEDMDALTFGATFLIRHFGFPNDKNKKMEEYDLPSVLAGIGITHEQFVDLCILLGCDFCDTLKGVGPATALRLLKSHGSIEKIMESEAGKKFTAPERFDFQSARSIFLEADKHVDTSIKGPFNWKKPDGEALFKFMVEENNFDKNRINNCLERIKKLSKNSGQATLDSFFGAAKRAPVVVNATKRSLSKENTVPTKKNKKK